jgi:hypothetical protein
MKTNQQTIIWCALLLLTMTSCWEMLGYDELSAKDLRIEKVEEGKSVTVEAEPEPGFEFSHWLKDGEIVSTNQTFTFSMPAKDLTLKAVFTRR